MWPLQTWCLNGAPVMSGCHIGFIANSPIIHQDICTKVMGFGHVMTPVMIIKHSSKGQTTQNCFLRKCLLSMAISSSPHKSAGQAWVICYSAFFPLKQEIKAFVESREEDTTLLSDTSVRHWVAAWSCVPDICDREIESPEPKVTRQRQNHMWYDQCFEGF